MESLHSFCVKAWIMIVGSKPEGIGYLVGLRAFFFLVVSGCYFWIKFAWDGREWGWWWSLGVLHWYSMWKRGQPQKRDMRNMMCDKERRIGGVSLLKMELGNVLWVGSFKESSTTRGITCCMEAQRTWDVNGRWSEECKVCGEDWRVSWNKNMGWIGWCGKVRMG